MKTKLVKDFIGNIINNLIPFKSKYEKIFTNQLTSSSGIQGLYDYGCQPNQYKMAVYRITYTKPDGSVIEFSWNQIKDYCQKYQLECVKEFYFGRAMDLHPWISTYGKNYEELLQEWRESLIDLLQSSFNMEKDCKECKNKLPAEGFVFAERWPFNILSV